MGRLSSASDALIHIAYILQHPSPTVAIIAIILINLSHSVYIPFFIPLSLKIPDPLSEPRGDLCLYNLCLYPIIPDPLSEPRGDLCLYNLCLYPIIPDPLSLSFCLLSLTWWCGMMWREKYPTVIGRWEHYASTARNKTRQTGKKNKVDTEQELGGGIAKTRQAQNKNKVDTEQELGGRRKKSCPSPAGVQTQAGHSPLCSAS